MTFEGRNPLTPSWLSYLQESQQPHPLPVQLAQHPHLSAMATSSLIERTHTTEKYIHLHMCMLSLAWVIFRGKPRVFVSGSKRKLAYEERGALRVRMRRVFARADAGVPFAHADTGGSFDGSLNKNFSLTRLDSPSWSPADGGPGGAGAIRNRPRATGRNGGPAGATATAVFR